MSRNWCLWMLQGAADHTARRLWSQLLLTHLPCVLTVPALVLHLHLQPEKPVQGNRETAERMLTHGEQLLAEWKHPDPIIGELCVREQSAQGATGARVVWLC